MRIGFITVTMGELDCSPDFIVSGLGKYDLVGKMSYNISYYFLTYFMFCKKDSLYNL